MTTTAVDVQPVTAYDVMTAPVWTVTPDTSPWGAWDLMVRQGIRHLVVVANGRCIGVLEDRELFAQWPMGPLALRRTRIASMVRRRTTCVLPGTDLRDVARVMREERVDAVPVVDAHGSLIGVVTGSDILGVVARCGVRWTDERDACES